MGFIMSKLRKIILGKINIQKMVNSLNEDRKTIDEMNKEDLEDYVESLEKGLDECVFNNDKIRKDILKEIDAINNMIQNS